MCFTWREGENELEVKGVELGEEEDEDDAENRQPPFQRWQRIPSELNPAVGTENKNLTFTSCSIAEIEY